MITMGTEREETIHDVIAKLNLELVEKNKEVLLENQSMAREEHKKKMELFYLQRIKLLSEISKEIEPEVLTSVSEFHTRFGHPVLKNPQLPTLKRINLRISLIQEELDELREATTKNDLVGVADSLCDLQYVLSGAILEFGMKDIFKLLFNEVHRSNMSKACSSKEEAEETVNFYKLQKGEDAVYKIDESGNFIVYRTSDNKILKSIRYTAPSLGEILNSVEG